MKYTVGWPISTSSSDNACRGETTTSPSFPHRNHKKKKKKNRSRRGAPFTSAMSTPIPPCVYSLVYIVVSTRPRSGELVNRAVHGSSALLRPPARLPAQTCSIAHRRPGRLRSV